MTTSKLITTVLLTVLLLVIDSLYGEYIISRDYIPAEIVVLSGIALLATNIYFVYSLVIFIVKSKTSKTN